jgi:hypothetical protein
VVTDVVIKTYCEVKRSRNSIIKLISNLFQVNFLSALFVPFELVNVTLLRHERTRAYSAFSKIRVLCFSLSSLMADINLSQGITEMEFLVAASVNQLAAADQLEAEGGHVEWKTAPVSTYALYYCEVFPP